MNYPAFLTPKRFDEHPCHFYMEVLPPPGGGGGEAQYEFPAVGGMMAL